MTNEAHVPGTRLRRFAERTFDRETLDHVVLPAIADLQHECVEGASLTVRLRAYLGVWKAMAICSMADAYRAARPTVGSVTRRMAVILPVVMTAIMLPPVLNTPRDPAGPSVLLLLTSPQAFAVALLVAYYFAVTLEQWPTSPRKLLPAVCGLSAIFTLVLFVLTMSIVPRTNQAYRDSVAERLGGSGRIVGPLTFGASEWTFTDLVQRAMGPPPDRSFARRQLSSRLLISTAPIMIGFVALGISGYARKIALFSGVWVLMLYIAALRSTVASAYQGPPPERVWMVNAIFTIAGLWLVWLRPRPDDRGPESRLPMP